MHSLKNLFPKTVPLLRNLGVLEVRNYPTRNIHSTFICRKGDQKNKGGTNNKSGNENAANKRTDGEIGEKVGPTKESDASKNQNGNTRKPPSGRTPIKNFKIYKNMPPDIDEIFLKRNEHLRFRRLNEAYRKEIDKIVLYEKGKHNDTPLDRTRASPVFLNKKNIIYDEKLDSMMKNLLSETKSVVTKMIEKDPVSSWQSRATPPTFEEIKEKILMMTKSNDNLSPDKPGNVSKQPDQSSGDVNSGTPGDDSSKVIVSPYVDKDGNIDYTRAVIKSSSKGDPSANALIKKLIADPVKPWENFEIANVPVVDHEETQSIIINANQPMDVRSSMIAISGNASSKDLIEDPSKLVDPEKPSQDFKIANVPFDLHEKSKGAQSTKQSERGKAGEEVHRQNSNISKKPTKTINKKDLGKHHQHSKTRKSAEKEKRKGSNVSKKPSGPIGKIPCKPKGYCESLKNKKGVPRKEIEEKSETGKNGVEERKSDSESYKPSPSTPREPKKESPCIPKWRQEIKAKKKDESKKTHKQHIKPKEEIGLKKENDQKSETGKHDVEKRKPDSESNKPSPSTPSEPKKESPCIPKWRQEIEAKKKDKSEKAQKPVITPKEVPFKPLEEKPTIMWKEEIQANKKDKSEEERKLEIKPKEGLSLGKPSELKSTPSKEVYSSTPCIKQVESNKINIGPCKPKEEKPIKPKEISPSEPLEEKSTQSKGIYPSTPSEPKKESPSIPKLKEKFEVKEKVKSEEVRKLDIKPKEVKSTRSKEVYSSTPSEPKKERPFCKTPIRKQEFEAKNKAKSKDVKIPDIKPIEVLSPTKPSEVKSTQLKEVYPHVKKVETKVAANVADPCVPKKVDPCKSKTADPCKLKVAEPCKPKIVKPCKQKVADSCKPKVADPCKSKVADPCKPKVAVPCKPKIADPCEILKDTSKSANRPKSKKPQSKNGIMNLLSSWTSSAEVKCPDKKIDYTIKPRVVSPCKPIAVDPCKPKAESKQPETTSPCKSKIVDSYKPKEVPCNTKQEKPSKSREVIPCKPQVVDRCKGKLTKEKQEISPCSSIWGVKPGSVKDTSKLPDKPKLKKPQSKNGLRSLLSWTTSAEEKCPEKKSKDISTPREVSSCKPIAVDPCKPKAESKQPKEMSPKGVDACKVKEVPCESKEEKLIKPKVVDPCKEKQEVSPWSSIWGTKPVSVEDTSKPSNKPKAKKPQSKNGLRELLTSWCTSAEEKCPEKKIKYTSKPREVSPCKPKEVVPCKPAVVDSCKEIPIKQKQEISSWSSIWRAKPGSVEDSIDKPKSKPKKFDSQNGFKNLLSKWTTSSEDKCPDKKIKETSKRPKKVIYQDCCAESTKKLKKAQKVVYQDCCAAAKEKTKKILKEERNKSKSSDQKSPKTSGDGQCG